MGNNFSMLDAFVSLKDVDDAAVEGMIKSKSLTEGKSFSIHSTAAEFDEAKQMLEKTDDDAIEVIDVNADTLDHIKSKTDYVGQFILTCKRCRTNRFVEADLLEPDSDDPDLYNVSDECPNCHAEGSGFELMGQVGKVPKEEPAADVTGTDVEPVAADDVTLDNDLAADDVTFDNDVSADAASSETESEDTAAPASVSDETDEGEDFSRFEQEDETDGMETTTSEDDLFDYEETSELGDEIKDSEPTDEDNEDVSEAFKPDVDVLQMNKYAAEAWLMNRVISSMNNEEAYYSSWLYYWPDGCDEEECAVTFNDKETFDELKAVFERVYKDYHEDELFDADEETLAYARKQDRLLGLRPIQNLKPRFKEQLTEDFDTDSLKDLFKLIIDADDIKHVEVYDAESGKKIFEGPSADLTPDLKGSKLVKYSVGTNSTLTVLVSSDITDEKSPRVKDVLKPFSEAKNDIGLFELLDDGDEKELIVKDANEALRLYGNMEVISIEQPSILKLFLHCPQMVALEEVEKDPTDKLVEDIVNANNLSIHKLDKPLSSEYWIAESIYSGEDLAIIFEQYVRDHQELVYEFKKVTGFRTKLEEQFMEEHDVGSLDDLYEQLYHIKKEEVQPVQEAYLDIANAVVTDDTDFDESLTEAYNAGDWVEVNLNAKKDGTPNIIPVKVYKELYHGKTFLGWAWGEKQYEYPMSAIVKKIDMDDTDAIIRKYTPGRNDLDEPKSMEEGYRGDSGLDDILGWLQDHEQAWDDFCAHFEDVDDEDLTQDMVVGWISEHEQLYDDFLGYFGKDEFLDEDSTLVESSEDPYDRIYADIEKLLAAKGYDVTDENVKAYMEASVEEVYDIYLSVEDWFESVETEYPEDLKKLKKVTECKKGPTVRSFKDRKELAEAIEECKNNTRPYTVRRSTIEGYRYDLIEDFEDETALVPATSDTSELISNDGALLLPAESKAALDKIKDVSEDIAEAIKKYYDIDADPKLIVADIIQDLSLISGHIRPEDLADTAVNKVTIQMYNDYNEFYNFVDAFMSAVSGETIRSTPESKFRDAIKILNGPAFSKETIDKTIGSQRFLMAARSGAVPYIPANVTPRLTEDFSDSRYEAATDELLNVMADHNFDISDKDVKLFVGNQVHDFVNRFDLNTDAWFDHVATEYKSALDRLQKLDYLEESKSIKEGLHKIYVNGELTDEIESNNPTFDVDKKAFEYKKMNGTKEVRVVYADGSSFTMHVSGVTESINPDDAANDQIDMEADNMLSDEELASINAEIALTEAAERYIIKTSTLVPAEHGGQTEEVEKFVANSKEEADAKYEELIASGLYDEVELPVPFLAEDFNDEGCYCIVAITKDGKRKFYKDGSFIDDYKEATTWNDLDAARAEWFAIDKSKYKRVFVPNYTPETFANLDEELDEAVNNMLISDSDIDKITKVVKEELLAYKYGDSETVSEKDLKQWFEFKNKSVSTGVLTYMLYRVCDKAAMLDAENTALAKRIKDKLISMFDSIIKDVSVKPYVTYNDIDLKIKVVLKTKTPDKESVEEGLFGIKTKKEKEKEAKAKAEREAKKKADREEAERIEKDRQADVARGWKEREDREKQANAEYNRSRYNDIKGDKPSNTGYRGVNYSGGDYYTESKSSRWVQVSKKASSDYRYCGNGGRSWVTRDSDNIDTWDSREAAIEDGKKNYKRSFKFGTHWDVEELTDVDAFEESKSINEDALKDYLIYREGNTLELVSFLRADSLESAKKKASELGYDLEYHRVEEDDGYVESFNKETVTDTALSESLELSTEHAVVSVVDRIKSMYEAGVFDMLPVGRDRAFTADIAGPDKDRLVGYFSKQPEFKYEMNTESGIISHEFISDKYDIEIFDSFIQMYRLPQNEALSESEDRNNLVEYLGRGDEIAFEMEIGDKLYAVSVDDVTDALVDLVTDEDINEYTNGRFKNYEELEAYDRENKTDEWDNFLFDNWIDLSDKYADEVTEYLERNTDGLRDITRDPDPEGDYADYLYDQWRDRQLGESLDKWLGNISNEDTVELYYEFEFEARGRNVSVDHVYKISPADAAEVIQDLIDLEDPAIPRSAFETEEEYNKAFEKYLEDNIDELIEKYYNELLDAYEDQAEDEAYDNFDLDEYESNEEDDYADRMHDAYMDRYYFGEGLNVGDFTNNYSEESTAVDYLKALASELNYPEDLVILDYQELPEYADFTIRVDGDINTYRVHTGGTVTLKEEASEPEIDFDSFVKDLNEYFDDAYEDTILFEASRGTVDKDGKILLEGIITGENGERGITFRFDPETPLTEELTKETFVEKLQDMSFTVSNNVSEEMFRFTFNK